MRRKEIPDWVEQYSAIEDGVEKWIGHLPIQTGGRDYTNLEPHVGVDAAVNEALELSGLSSLSSKSIVFAAAKPADADGIAQLLRSNGLPAGDFLPHLGHFIVARERAQIVGAVGFEAYAPIALLRSLVVAGRCRRTGIGSKLLDRIEDYARSRLISEFYLLTTTAESFFTKHGYERLARNEAPGAIAGTEEFRSLCPSTAVLLVRRFAS